MVKVEAPVKKCKLMLFGGFRLININGETLAPNSRKAKALLAWLAVNPDRQHPREQLAAVLWPDSDEIQGRHSLRQALAELRKVLPDDAGPLHTTKDWIVLDSEQIAVDVIDFDKELTSGTDMALVGARMHGDAVRTGAQAGHRRAHHIGVAATPGVA